MLADLHAHYPMHIVATDAPRATIDSMRTAGGRPRIRDKLRAWLLALLSRLINNRTWWSDFRVTAPLIRQGSARIVLSVLYRPFEEMDLSKDYAAPPAAGYFADLLNDIERVEQDIAKNDRAEIRLARNVAELEQAIADGATAMVHCVEGGFHLGDADGEIERNVETLANKGIAYITLAHLFFRQVATNAPALPFLPDWLYNLVFPQRKGEGLTARGKTAVRAMVRHRVLVDISHMRPDAVAETLDLLDEIDPGRTVPMISSHAGYRFGSQEYMHDEPQIRRIKERDGVIGLIMAHHQINDGIRRTNTTTLDESMKVIEQHIDQIAKITGGYEHVAIGTDFDGFIKPTLGGLESMADLTALEERLVAKYGAANAKLIASDNVLRVLRKGWK
jgi:microsomal dipeptidase-like Zn-dependent dipeptidase